MFPPWTTEARLVPSLEDVMPLHCFEPNTEVSSVHVAPESVDVQMFPSQTTAASLTPSLEDVMPNHFFMIPVEVTSVQFAPESVDVQMFPSLTVFPWFPSQTTAASLVPSLEDVMPLQSLVLPISNVTPSHIKSTSAKYNAEILSLLPRADTFAIILHRPPA